MMMETAWDTVLMREKLRSLPLRHRLAHLAALIRAEREGSTRTEALASLLRDQMRAMLREGG